MEDFTFIMCSYNQQDYVLQQLESIKYQIEHYGHSRKCHFILSDDCSTDDTVAVVRKWVQYNRELFSSINILIKGKNEGVVRNHITALRNAKTKWYKVLSGDDIYYKNNIFDVMGSRYNFMITPVLSFDRYGNFSAFREFDYKWLLKKTAGNELKEFLRWRIKNGNSIDAPGVFYAAELVDEGLFTELASYSWIEDQAMWNYFVNKEATRVGMSTNPYILYRLGSGISTNKKHPKREAFLQDDAKVQKDIFILKGKYPEYCLYKWKRSIVKKLDRIDLFANARIKEYNANMSLAKKEVKAYLNFLNSRVEAYVKAQDR